MPDESKKKPLKLTDIQKQIEELDFPISKYAAVKINGNDFEFAEFDLGEIDTFTHPLNGNDISDVLCTFLDKRAREKSFKYIAVGLTGDLGENIDDLATDLWLKNDIVPIFFEDKPKNVKEAAELTSERFDSENIAKIEVNEDNNEVLPKYLVGLGAHKKATVGNYFEKLLEYTEKFRGKRMAFFSATPQGGGVALMRHALMRIFKLLDLDVHWYILNEKAEAFDVTKVKFHNILQAVTDSETRLTERDKEVYTNWMQENVVKFKEIFAKSDVIVIDDPQPSGLISYIKEQDPNIPIIYRSHIQIESHLVDKPGTPQSETWEFIWNEVKKANIFVSHPVLDFIPKNVPQEKIVLMPPTTDPLDGLNKDLTERQTQYYIDLFNRVLLEEGQMPLDTEREFIVQIARFDPSKGIMDVLESYTYFRELCKQRDVDPPQLVIAGHGSVDDPDGVPIYNLTRKTIREKYPDLEDDIKVAKLHHTDQLLNVLMSECKVSLQLSHKEGFEIKVTEALLKGKPVITYNAGGIPLQIEKNKNGFVLETVGDTKAVGDKLIELFSDDGLYEEMSKNAEKLARRDVLTVPNAVNWLYLATEILENPDKDFNMRHVKKEL